MAYTKGIIIDFCENEMDDYTNFYKKPFVNYIGQTTDTKEYYIDVIVDYLLSKNNVEKFFSIPVITRIKSYKMKGHDGKSSINNTNRDEEHFCSKIYGYFYDIIGEMIDYQVPLKNVQKDDAGKIDLLSVNEEDKTIFIHEVKKLNSEETILRCILEIFTYYKRLDQVKFKNDFGYTDDYKIQPSVLIFKDSEPYNEFVNRNKKGSKLIDLCEKLNVKIFYLNDYNDTETKELL